LDAGGPSRELGSFARKGKRQDAGAKRENAMLTIIKIAMAALITFGVLNPSFAPHADDAKCSCKANG
jgi:hypothetical protein